MAENKVGHKPTVSIAVPSYQQGRFLADALESLIIQKEVNVKIAVLDAGSTDDSVHIISRYQPFLTYWRSHNDGGQAAAINEGIARLGESDYVGWLNADDTLLPQGIINMVRFLENNADCLAVFGKAYITNENNQKTGEYPTSEFIPRTFAEICTICQPATLVRKSVWDQVGGVNESLHMCMDYDLWWRISKLGRLGYLEEYTACSRDHGETKTRNNMKLHLIEGIKTIKQNYGYVPFRWYLNLAAVLKQYKPEDSTVFQKIGLRLYAIFCYFKFNLIKADDELPEGNK